MEPMDWMKSKADDITEELVRVSTVDIHGEFIREYYDNLNANEYSKLLSESPEISNVENFLSQYESDLAVPGEQYFYVSIMHIPVPDEGVMIDFGCFAKPHTLIKFDNSGYIFDINGQSKIYPEKQSRMQHTFIIKNNKDVSQMLSAISLKFNNVSKKIIETSSVTDYNPPSQGGTREELLAKFAKTKSPDDASAARRAGATQVELQAAQEDDGVQEMKEIHEFEEWADRIVEGTWALPENQKQLEPF